MNSTPVSDYIPLDGFGVEEMLKSSNSGNDEANNSTKLSCEMELCDSSSIPLGGDSPKTSKI